MITMQLNEHSAEDYRAIQQLRKLGYDEEEIQRLYDEQQEKDKKAKIKASEILKNDIEICTPEQQAAVDMAVAALNSEVGDTIPREKLETAKKMIKARFMDSGETVMQNETRREVCREFIKILEEVCG